MWSLIHPTQVPDILLLFLHQVNLSGAILIDDFYYESIPQESDDANLIAHWNMDDMSGVAVQDISGNNLDGLLVNGAQWDPNGKYGGAVSCDGINDYIEIQDNDLLDPGNNNFTVSFWVYKREPSIGWDNNWGVNKWNTGAAKGTNEWILGLGVNGNTDRPFFDIESGTTNFRTASNDDISLNEWHLITGVREDSIIKLYVDAVLKSAKSVGDVSVNNVGRNIRIANSQRNAYYTNAMYDDVRIYDKALNQAEILGLYTLSNNPPIVDAGADQVITLPNNMAALSGNVTDDGLPADDSLTTLWTKVSGPGEVTFSDSNLLVTNTTFSSEGNYLLELSANDGELYASDTMVVLVQAASSNDPNMIAYWSMDDTAGTVVNDLSDNNLNGVLVNGAQWDPNGKIGSAVSCDGINDYIEIQDNDLLDPGNNNFTVSIWVYKREPSIGWDNNWGVNKWNTGAAKGTNEWILGLGVNGNTDRPFFDIESGTTNFRTSSNDDISLNEWHLITGVREDSIIKLYVDAVLKSAKSVGDVSVNNVGRNIRIANSQRNAYYTNGMFDDVRIYSKALSPSEILSLYSMAPLNFAGNSLPSFIDTTICQGDSIYIDGSWEKSAGLYRTNHINKHGYDSVSTIKLSILARARGILGRGFNHQYKRRGPSRGIFSWS